MNPRILKRFIIYTAVLIFVVFSAWAVFEMFTGEEPGDYHVRQGDILLSGGNHAEAMNSFGRALREMPNHRGALMGRALVFIQTKKYDEAIAELGYLISYLKRTLKPDDVTGQAALAAAYANRGIVNDRRGRYKKALADYIEALKVDTAPLKGPGLIDRIIYGTPNPSTVRKRAIYLEKQLALPPEKRLLRVPEIDKKQRTHKP